jgi:hypothetical protein
MSLTVAFAKAFGTAFVPKDTLYRQAQDLIQQADVDGDGVLDLNDKAQRDKLDDLHRKGFLLADSLGWQNGVVSVRELRNGLKKYDTGDDPKTGGPDGAIGGVEWLRIIRDSLAFPG